MGGRCASFVFIALTNLNIAPTRYTIASITFHFTFLSLFFILLVKKSETFNIRFAFIEMVHKFMRYNAFKNRWHRMFGLFPFVILTRSSVFFVHSFFLCTSFNIRKWKTKRNSLVFIITAVLVWFNKCASNIVHLSIWNENELFIKKTILLSHIHLKRIKMHKWRTLGTRLHWIEHIIMLWIRSSVNEF